MNHEWQLLLMALSQLTRVPVPAAALQRPQWRHHAARHWPAVGLLVGATGSATLWAAAHLWPGPVAVLAAAAVVVWFTRAAGEAGFAAVFPTPAGSGVWLLLALRVAALQGLAARDLNAALATWPLAHALGCGAAVLLWHRLPAAAAAAGGADPVGPDAGAEAARRAMAAGEAGTAHGVAGAGIRTATGSGVGSAVGAAPVGPGAGDGGRAAPRAATAGAASADTLSLLLAAVWCALAAAVASLYLPATAWLAGLVATVALALLLEGPLRRRCGGYRDAVGAALRALAEATVLLAVLAVLAQG